VKKNAIFYPVGNKDQLSTAQVKPGTIKNGPINVYLDDCHTYAQQSIRCSENY